jgi:hypothetical protein
VKCNFIEKRPELKDIKKDAEIKVVNIEDFKKNRDKNQ